MKNCGCDNLFRMFEGYYGPYFTPTVDAAGNLTWENNAGLPNPPAVNIKGPQGDSGSGALTDEQKQAILQLAQKVAYIDANGQTYYDDLYDAFYGSAPAPTLTSITASYTQTGTIYTTDSVDVIPQRGTLVVTAHYSDSSSAVVASGYTLAGTLTEGASTVTVSYQGLTTTITVQVTAVAGTYTIQNNLTGCTTSNSATTIAEGSNYSATITASVGYTLTGATATITMGGTELTGAFNNGTISIPNVTGNLVITVVATARTINSISAVYSQPGAVYDTDSLDSLKDDLVVTATYSDSGTAVVPSTDYTLSGTLVADTTSTITVTYGGKTSTFNVFVTKGELDTTAQIATEGYVTHDTGATHDTVAIANGGITLAYDMDVPSTVLAPAGVIVQSGILSNSTGTIRAYNGSELVTYVDEVNRWGKAPASSYTEYSQSWNVSEYDHITFSLDTRYLDDSYMYDGITGQVWFAGRNTPFYGMTNVSEAYGELPDGYTKLSYVKSTGEQHINTGYTPTPSTKFYIDAQTRTAGASAPGGQDEGGTQRTMFEAINGTSWAGNNILLAPYRENGTGYWGWYNASSTKQIYKGNVDADRHNLTLIRNAYKLENTLNWVGTPATPSITYTYPVSLFGFLRNGTYSHMNDDMTLYAFRMYEGEGSSMPTVNLVPCKDPNDVVGLYDTIRREFYHSTTGTELIGGDVI